MLSAQSIRHAVASGRLVIAPFDDGSHLQPCSYDVSLLAGALLWPGRFLLLSTAEWIELPANLQAQLSGRSSFGRLAIQVHSTAGFIDPGFRGQITMEVKSLQPWYMLLWPPAWVRLRAGDRVGQLAFSLLDRPTERPYVGRYMGQVGATRSRL